MFIGIDLSITNTGLAVYNRETGGLYLKSISTPRKLSPSERVILAYEEIKDYFTKDSIVVLEDFALSGLYQPSGYFCERLELMGLVKYTLYKSKIVYYLVRPNLLKMFAGKASMHKKEVKDAVKELWAIDTKNHDESDAFICCLLGLYAHNHTFSGVVLNKKQQQALIKFKTVNLI